MSERKSSSDLGPNLETLLGSFPVPERDWENDALAVEARIAGTECDATPSALLAAPLPSEPGDSDAPPSATQTPLANSGVRTHSLAALARRSVANKQASDREMARETLALAAQQRPNAEEVLALREAMSSRLPAAVAAPHAAAPERETLTASPAHAATAPSAAHRRSKFTMAAAAIALAAGALLWFEHTAPAPLITAVLSAPPALDTGSEVPSGASSAPALQGIPNGIDPSTLPVVNAEPVHEKTAAVGRAAPALAANAPRSEQKIVLQDDPAAAPASTAVAGPGVAKTLPPDPELRPADSNGDSLPAKPSTGAVQAALGAVMSGARHCVAGDDGPSSAVVVFASDGRVQSVAVSGPAAGKSTGSCIAAQLGRAHVQPFAVPNFSVNATVRPD